MSKWLGQSSHASDGGRLTVGNWLTRDCRTAQVVSR